MLHYRQLIEAFQHNATAATCTRSGAIFSTNFCSRHPRAQKEAITTLLFFYELNPNIKYFEETLSHTKFFDTFKAGFLPNENLFCSLLYSFYPY